LAPYLEKFMDNPSWRFRVRFDDAVLSWEGWRKKLDLRVIGVRFMDRNGVELISVPRMSVVFDGRALLAGQFRVSGLELIAPKLRLLRHGDGRIEIANNDGAAGSGERTGLTFAPALLAAGGRGGAYGIFGDLRSLSVLGADLSFHDMSSGLKLAVPAADLSLRQETDGVSMRLSTRLRIGQSEAALGISALYRDEATAIIAAVNFAEVDIAGLAKAIGGTRLETMRGLAVVAAGRLDLALSPNGIIDSLSFEVTTGPGRIALPRPEDKAVTIAALSAKGQFSNNFSQLKLSSLHLDLGAGLTAQATGQWARSEGGGEGGGTFKGKGTLVNLPVAKLPLYWPENLAVEVRNWILKNIHGGLVTEGRFAIDLRPGDLDRETPRPGMARLDWTFQDVSADYFGELPPIKGASGSGFIDGLEFGLTVTDATAGGMKLSEGKLHVADLTVQPPILDIEFVAHGPIGDALALLDAKPLQFTTALALRAEDAEGQSATRARLRVPLSEDVTLEQVGFSAAANIAELSLRGIPGGYRVRDGAFTLTVARDALKLSGRGAVNGVPLQINWKRDFQAGPNMPGDHLIIRGNAGPAQWRALGLPAMPRLRGVVGMALSVDVYPGGARRGAGRFDLTAADLDWREIGWAKPATVPAEMNLTFQSAANGALILDRWEYSGGGLQARGRAEFDRASGLVSLTSDHFALGATQLAVDLRAGPNGGYRLDLRGPSLDLRYFVPRWLEAGDQGDEPALDLKLQIERVHLTDKVTLSRLVGAGRRRGGEWLSADLRGAMPGGQSIGITVRAEDKGRRFIIVGGDAGGMAQALGLYPDARGGTMYLNFLVPAADDPDGVISGYLRADNFRVVKAQVLTRLLTLGSLTGLSDVLNDKGITFTRLNAPFTMRDGRLHIERARAVGPAMAVIATGDYTRDTKALRFHGTIVPSYTLNSVLGIIPVLGELLIGRKGEGVFAFTYKVNGTLEKPKLSVNLLSALAPGFLRRIVEGLENPAVAGESRKPDPSDR
jgi:hypothetical protein